uniref:Membrane anchored junction protein n=1 Tax=Serinus canaria TaxID=9135 RepID=A0A8C9UDN9_SERCA
MSLKPFTYPLPETRFFHAGRHVYKFKIRYGNFNRYEVIRVILGNLDNLHPFSTDHFTIFPYLSKWERVSKMKFKHENVHLVPYPYICTLYLELNSFQRNISCGKSLRQEGCRKPSSLFFISSHQVYIASSLKVSPLEKNSPIPSSCLHMALCCTGVSGPDWGRWASAASSRGERSLLEGSGLAEFCLIQLRLNHMAQLNHPSA